MAFDAAWFDWYKSIEGCMYSELLKGRIPDIFVRPVGEPISRRTIRPKVCPNVLCNVGSNPAMWEAIWLSCCHPGKGSNGGI